ncbi:uncharacterized protein LOC9300950 isoform X1 [Arabidopsis lyrata subsp. lyrata]|uniref:uncharacterized protein LOC9300950 isoform X1 n=1 Tax=Arabidopsis lyrata subsp. lyrata TaxID=81972 RepID=UPI000A29D7F4|nr:uncharacterized protein LOC9300950 isoform X1 [Arabidopsis lyrata subsp. lyrata]|eukprot:XP_020881787.1 uncharacterized protein LOC9300950 isoform X1 [Arabidopsis lyrata subsp. lyrata]
MGCFSCFDGTQKEQRKEEERQASAEARARAAEAAQRRKEQFDKSAAGRAAQAQLQQMDKQSANINKGEPVLKVSFTTFLCFIIMYHHRVKVFLFNFIFAMTCSGK